MDDDEIKKHVRHVLKTASRDYLLPGPELIGKYLVCKDFKIIAVFDTEADALNCAGEHAPGSIEIRHVVETEHGTSTHVTIPGAISKLDE